jgi:hypothetical protein
LATSWKTISPTVWRFTLRTGVKFHDADGFSVGLSCPNNRYVCDENICLAVVSMLAKVGIKIEPQIEPTAKWSQRLNNLDVSMYMIGHAGLPTADAYSTLSEVTATRGGGMGGLNAGRAEALLSAVERMKCGTTCGVSYLDGGDDIMRVDDPVYGERHCQAVQQVGIRSFLAGGPCRPPLPRLSAGREGGTRRDAMVWFEGHWTRA